MRETRRKEKTVKLVTWWN